MLPALKVSDDVFVFNACNTAFLSRIDLMKKKVSQQKRRIKTVQHVYYLAKNLHLPLECISIQKSSSYSYQLWEIFGLVSLVEGYILFVFLWQWSCFLLVHNHFQEIPEMLWTYKQIKLQNSCIRWVLTRCNFLCIE